MIEIFEGISDLLNPILKLAFQLYLKHFAKLSKSDSFCPALSYFRVTVLFLYVLFFSRKLISPSKTLECPLFLHFKLYLLEQRFFAQKICTKRLKRLGEIDK